MNEKNLHHHLKELKNITPRDDFKAALRQQLMMTRPSIPVEQAAPFWGIFRTAASFAMILLFVFSGWTAYEEMTAPAELAGLNDTEILNELAHSGDIDIYLNEISYFNEADQAINIALNELTQ